MNNLEEVPVERGLWRVGELRPGTEVLCQAGPLTMLSTGGRDVVVGRHLHERHDEFGLLVSGQGTLQIGDETVEVGPGSTWSIPRGLPHAGRYVGEFRVVVWFTPGDDLDAPDRVTLE